MTGRLRAALAALVVILIAAAGSAYALNRAAAARATQDDSAFQVATTGDVTGLINDSNTQAQLLNVAVNKLESAYYKPVDPQTPPRGEAKALDEYLKAKHIAHATVPDDGNVAQILAYAQSHYASKLGANAATDLTETALRGVMDSVDDPYTVYLSPKEIQGLQESLSGGNFGGIGVYIYQLKDGQVVVQPIDGLPASRAGMKPGEVVDAVNGKPIKGMTLDRVEQLIRGPEGTNVQLRTHVYNKTGEHSFTITREVIHVPTVRAKMENGYDYIRLSDFGTTSAQEVRKALVEGRAKGAKGFILDLRNNGGGLLDAAVKISSYFIPHGTIVATIDRQGNRSEEEALGTAIGGLQPLVILVNKYTASASEITSGALQDYRLAKLIGTKTFGKGVVQSIYPMPDSGALKITTARYVTPLGRDIQHKGIMPDIVVQQNPDPSLIDTPADKQLAAAKATLKQLAQQ
ncbi:MAG TPA: S41 family peptidase [Candidatus Aquilonibacter sp.]|nr:S41 family peptidase [Candidatus Aquilonibacter sp.]